MSDRTRSSVRTGSPDGDGAAPAESRRVRGAAPVTATQSIPTTGTQRAQARRRQAPAPRRPPSTGAAGACRRPAARRRRPVAGPHRAGDPAGPVAAGRPATAVAAPADRRRPRGAGARPRWPRTPPGPAAAAAHRHLVGVQDLAGAVDRAVLHLDGRGRRPLRRAERASASSTPSTTCSVSSAAPSGQRRRADVITARRRVLRCGGHRRDQRRAHDGAVHRRHVHLQHVRRPGRRPGDHPLRARLSARRPSGLRPRPERSQGLEPR